MRIYALLCMFLTVSIYSSGQVRSYKNQLNKQLNSTVELEHHVKVKVQKTTGGTPKYRIIQPNLEWVNRSIGTKVIWNYKQSGGIPK
jgi:hypothetical protein